MLSDRRTDEQNQFNKHKASEASLPTSHLLMTLTFEIDRVYHLIIGTMCAKFDLAILLSTRLFSHLPILTLTFDPEPILTLTFDPEN